MKNWPVVYIASAYTKGDIGINVRRSMMLWDRLMDSGLVLPVCPLWSHFQHILKPRRYQDWIDYDLALIHRYDACLRLAGDSSGADGEVEEFVMQGKPVFWIDTPDADLAELYEWARLQAAATPA